MKKVMFYCQHILGMGHLIRSVEIVKGLIPNFQICFINGGEIIKEFEFPQEISVVNIPAVKTDSEFNQLQPVDDNFTMEELEEIRKNILLNICDRFQPDILIIELFPFGRKRFQFELIPLIEKARLMGTKIVSSVRDIVVTKQNQKRHEEKVVNLINKYFDVLLIHGDSTFVELNLSFSRISDLNCPVLYTGYVAQKIEQPQTEIEQPLILVSVGGGRFGHDLLECVAHAASILKSHIPHQIQMFTGPFCPEIVLQKLQRITRDLDNIIVARYTTNLLDYMQQADLSIGMSGYNTTMNILSTDVKAMMMAFQGNNDKEQETRVTKLAQLGRVKMIQPQDLQPEKFAHQIISYLQQQPRKLKLNLNGVANTSYYLRHLVQESVIDHQLFSIGH